MVSLILDKNSVKSSFSVKSFIVNWFDEIFFRQHVLTPNFLFFHSPHWFPEKSFTVHMRTNFCVKSTFLVEKLQELISRKIFERDRVFTTFPHNTQHYLGDEKIDFTEFFPKDILQKSRFFLHSDRILCVMQPTFSLRHFSWNWISFLTL